MAEAVKTPLTRERMRVDIARALRMAPEDLLDDEDLADLGLDSLRSMDLVVGWSQAGVSLEFSELAEKLTLGAWWGVAERAMTQRAVARGAHG